MGVLKSVKLTNLLSFGSSGESLDLGDLNVLIGPNSSGKSNVIEALRLFAATPRDFSAAIREGDGVTHWLWKGLRDPEAEIEAVLDHPGGSQPLRHRLAFGAESQRLRIEDEAIENEHARPGQDSPYFYYRFQRGDPVLNALSAAGSGVPQRRGLRREDLHPEQSVLSQRKDPDTYPELAYVGRFWEDVRIYQDLPLGRGAAVRRPQDTALDGSFLAPDASNLVLVLNQLCLATDVKKAVVAEIQRLNPRVVDFSFQVSQGTVQLFLVEEGLHSGVPATRLSDGTLRYLCLIAILLHPAPPRLLCMEEPETGLHPDALRRLGDLLVEASQRTQLVVTTHSTELLSALSPEHVLVCERGDEGSVVTRLQEGPLVEWLKDYTLGELWRMGELGGNRW